MDKGDRRAALSSLDPLTTLRFVAAFVVVLFHVALPHLPPDSIAARVLKHGWISVYFFFTLSGFVIGAVYAESRTSAARFWVLRAFRIWPLHLFALLCLVHYGTIDVPARFPDDNPWVVTASVALLVHGWTRFWSAINYPSWSLSTEIFFYALFPLLNHGLRRIATSRALLVLGIGVVLLQLVLALLPALSGDACAQGAECHTALQQWIYKPVGNTGFFVVGVVLGRVFIDEQRRQVRRPGNWLVLGGLVALVLVFATGLDRWDGLVIRAATMIPFAVIVYGSVHSSGVLHRVLAARPLVYLGDISYSIYLLQLPVLYLVGHLVLHRPTMWDLRVGDTFLYLATLIAASSLTYRFVENPFRKLGRRLIGESPR